MSDFLLTQVINYGAPILGLIVFIGAMGPPLPATLMVIAAGAFSNQGFLSWSTTALVVLACVVAGDSLSYAMGYYAREPVLRRFGKSERWSQAEAAFDRWGATSVLLTRFLITGLAVPVNLLAGTSNFGFRRFFLYDLAGETIWVFGYGGLGYLFGTQWELVGEFISSFGSLTLGLVILITGIVLAIRYPSVRARRTERRVE
ncbi:MAG: DedA family protein [Anaerolineales bacterium]